MSTATLDIDSVAATDETLQYRALHTGSIIGLVLGVLSAFMVVAAASSLEGSLWIAPVPVLGMFMSLRALAKIRREPDQYTGGAVAMLGLILSFVFLFGGVAYGGYVYVTELPEGYTRISFNAMKPDELLERGGVLVPPEIAALDGQKVFIKGYMRPPEFTRGIDSFLLVRDNQQCCFGDLSSVKYYDQVLVKMAGSRRLDYSNGLFRIGGILKVEPQNVALVGRRPVFSLQADYAQ
jgi:hypothetical protein